MTGLIKSALEFDSYQIQNFSEKLLKDVVENEFLSEFISKETKSAYRRDILTFFQGIQITYLNDLGVIHFSDMAKLVMEYIYSFKKTNEYHQDRIINPKTINRKAYSLSSFFNFLVDNYNYPRNPVARFKPEQAHKTSNTESLTRGEMQEILIYLKQKHKKNKAEYRNYLLISFMFALALRRHEAAKLQWLDIQVNSSGEPCIEVFQKGRTIKKLPLPLPLYNQLMEYKSMYSQESAYIFTPIKNNSTKDLTKPLSATQVNRIVTSIAKQLIPDKNITPHSFRKTFIELALNNNTPLIDIINGTGHSSVEMIKYYDGRDSIKNNAVNNVSNGML